MIELASRTVMGLGLLVASVGAADGFGDDWDQFAMFAAIGCLILVELALRAVDRHRIDVRPDIHEWLEDEAARTDDTVGAIADRAVVTYRLTEAQEPERELGR